MKPKPFCSRSRAVEKRDKYTGDHRDRLARRVTWALLSGCRVLN
ncbi:MAG: hypothetical protein R2762_06910 [Bryobacteraceae bacterium]